MNWYLQALKNYAVFSGRARRKEYWFFALFNSIFLIIAVLLDNIAGTAIEDLGYGLFYILYALAVLIPGLAVSVRRLHDVDKSGWMLLIALIPIAGGIWLIVLMATDSKPGPNSYGPNPKESYPGESAASITESSGSTAGFEAGDTVILIVVIWMLFAQLFWTIIPMTIHDYYEAGWFKVMSGVFSFIWAFVPLTLAFAVKNKQKQIVLFIIGGIYLIFNLTSSMMQFFR